MASFVHLASHKDVASIRRSGIGRPVFCVPVSPNFQATHQWVRELRRDPRVKRMVGVYFRIDDDEIVRASRFNEPKVAMAAKDAVKLLMREEVAPGFEVVVQRRVGRREIYRIATMPQQVGWRYFPEAREKKWNCFCPCCTPKGSIRGKIKRDRWEAMRSPFER